MLILVVLLLRLSACCLSLLVSTFHLPLLPGIYKFHYIISSNYSHIWVTVFKKKKNYISAVAVFNLCLQWLVLCITGASLWWSVRISDSEKRLNEICKLCLTRWKLFCHLFDKWKFDSMIRRMGFCALAKVTNCNSFPVVLYCMLCCTAVHILHSFSTDPCKNVLNCRVEPLTRQPLKFVPLELCPLSDEPLCASDGRTYPSECAMRATGIQKGVTLRKIHAGQCTTLGKAEACCL